MARVTEQDRNGMEVVALMRRSESDFESITPACVMGVLRGWNVTAL